MTNAIRYTLFKYSKKYLNKLGIHAFDAQLMVPRMTTNEYLFFASFLKNHTTAVYCESGSGGSTLMAEKIFSAIHSFETDAGFVAYMNGLLSNSKVNLIPVGPTEKFGYPTEKSAENAQKIARVFRPILEKYPDQPRLVFIDGRSRVGTALDIHDLLNDQDRVLIHDFKRTHYHAVLEVYKVEEQVEGLVVLTKKTVSQKQLDALKEKYSADLR